MTETLRTHIQLRPEQAAVVAAFQRLSAAMDVEAVQLASLYNQTPSADVLRGLMERLAKHNEQYLQQCQHSILIATEMPRNGNTAS